MNRFAKLAFAVALVSPGLTGAAYALDAGAIKPHMDVKGSDGKHVGTIDKIEGDQMVLTKDDPAANGTHHRLPVTAVDNVAKDAVTLKASAQQAMTVWTAVAEPGNDKPKAQ